MSAEIFPLPSGAQGRLRRELQLIRTLVRFDLSVQYQDSLLGYAWTVVKPLANFGITYLVFGRILRYGARFPTFPLYLILGLTLWHYFQGGTFAAMVSVVQRGGIVRRIQIRPVLLPIASTITTGFLMILSLFAVAFFIAKNRIVPQPSWLLVLPLFVELYLFTLAFSLLLAMLYVRFRDMRQVWELGTQLLFFLCPIVYPITVLPRWAEKLVLMNPLTQMMMDFRRLIMGSVNGQVLTIRQVLPDYYELVPICITFVFLGLVLFVFSRLQHGFAERI